MATEQDLWQFPCEFPIRVMGPAVPELLEQVLTVVQKHAPGDYSPQVRPSGKGNYHSIRLLIIAQSKQQLDALYRDLTALDIVKVVL
jgi:hypothetical protein